MLVTQSRPTLCDLRETSYTCVLVTQSRPTLCDLRETSYTCVLVTQSRPTLCDLRDCSPSGSSVHGILQAGILKWAAMSFSGIFPTQESNLCLLCLLHWQVGSSLSEPSGKPHLLYENNQQCTKLALSYQEVFVPRAMETQDHQLTA